MKRGLFLLLILTLVLTVTTRGTSAYFSDTEVSAGNILTAWANTTVTLLDDSFEGDPWDANWDDNGTTDWKLKGTEKYSGVYSAKTKKNENGYLTSDDLNASEAVSITVTFWFRPEDIEAGDILVQLYNGSTYNTLYDLVDYSTFENNVWCHFSEEITDSQYFNSGFRLSFDSSGLTESGETCYIDNVLLTMECPL